MQLFRKACLGTVSCSGPLHVILAVPCKGPSMREVQVACLTQLFPTGIVRAESLGRPMAQGLRVGSPAGCWIK